MADKKISALTAATLPLAGTEVLPIVQSSTTDNITVNNLAAGNLKSQSTTGVLQVTGPAAASTRVMTVPNANFTAARTDAGQTFSGAQTFDTSVNVNANSVTSKLDSYTATFGGNNYYSGELVLQDPIGRGFVVRSPSSILNGQVGTSTNHALEFLIGGTTRAWISETTFDLTISSGNVVQGTAAKGINFTANTPAAGMTSQLLNWYEEGTWTPTYVSSGASFTYAEQYGSYTRVGRLVIAQFRMNAATATGTTSNAVNVSGLPFTSANLNALSGNGVSIGLQTFPSVLGASTGNNSTLINLWIAGTTGQPTAANAVGAYLMGTAIYFAA